MGVKVGNNGRKRSVKVGICYVLYKYRHIFKSNILFLTPNLQLFLLIFIFLFLSFFRPSFSLTSYYISHAAQRFWGGGVFAIIKSLNNPHEFNLTLRRIIFESYICGKNPVVGCNGIILLLYSGLISRKVRLHTIGLYSHLDVVPIKYF